MVNQRNSREVDETVVVRKPSPKIAGGNERNSSKRNRRRNKMVVVRMEDGNKRRGAIKRADSLAGVGSLNFNADAG